MEIDIKQRWCGLARGKPISALHIGVDLTTIAVGTGPQADAALELAIGAHKTAVN